MLETKSLSTRPVLYIFFLPSVHQTRPTYERYLSTYTLRTGGSVRLSRLSPRIPTKEVPLHCQDDRRICLLVVDTFTFNFFHDDGCSAGMRDCALSK